MMIIFILLSPGCLKASFAFLMYWCSSSSHNYLMTFSFLFPIGCWGPFNDFCFRFSFLTLIECYLVRRGWDCTLYIHGRGMWPSPARPRSRAFSRCASISFTLRKTYDEPLNQPTMTCAMWLLLCYVICCWLLCCSGHCSPPLLLPLLLLSCHAVNE